MKKFLAVFIIFLIPASVLLSQTEESAAQIYSRALMMKSQKDYQNAITEFKKITDSEIPKETIYFQLSECYFLLNDVVASIENAKKSIQFKPDYEDPHYYLVQSYYKLKQFDNAVDAAEHILFYQPDQLQYHFLAAYICYTELKNYKLTIYHMETLLEISQTREIDDKFKEQAHMILAESYYQVKDYEKCLEHFNYTISYNKENTIKILDYTNLFLNDDKYENTIDSLDILFSNLTDEQKSTDFTYKLNAIQGRLLYLKNDFSAKTYLRIGMKAKDTESIISKALFYEMIKKDDESLKIILPVLKANSSIISAQYAAAKIYERKGDTQKAYDHYVAAGLQLIETDMTDAAINMFKQAVKLNDSDPVLHYYIGQQYEKQKKYSLAIYHYKKSFSKPEDAEQLVHIGFLYHLNKDIENSKVFIELASREFPENSKVYFFKAVIAMDNKKNTEAIQDLEKALQYDAGNDIYLFYTAMNYEESGNIDKSIEYIEQALAKDESNPTYQNYLAYMYSLKKVNLDAAFTLVNKALKTEPFNGAFLDTLGWIYYQKGDYGSALTYLMRASYNSIAADEIDSTIYDHIGDTYSRLQNNELAVHYWNEAIKIKPDKNISSKISKLKQDK
ncbi:MAG: tetratricopeptide repeat protein [Spirochaetes bacterium]|nr:tetratricopeptide repeat protein [Spirochaetota bacterium]